MSQTSLVSVGRILIPYTGFDFSAGGSDRLKIILNLKCWKYPTNGEGLGLMKVTYFFTL